MKTISCIVVVFFLGVIGWIGLDEKEKKEQETLSSERIYENDILIVKKEAEAEHLKQIIIQDQAIIEAKISE